MGVRGVAELGRGAEKARKVDIGSRAEEGEEGELDEGLRLF